MELARFELKRIFKDRAIPIIMIGLILFVAMSSFLAKTRVSYPEERSNEFHYAYSMNLSMLDMYQNDENSFALVEQIKEENKILEEYFNQESKNDKQGMLAAELKYWENALLRTQSGSLSGHPILDIQQNIETIEYLLAHGLLPLYEKDVENPAAYQVLDFIYHYEIYLIIAVLLIAYLMTADRRLNIINFVNSVPERLGKLAVIKFLSAYLLGLFVAVLPALTVFVISLKNGVGSLNYPIITSGSNPQIVIEPLSTVLFKSFFLLALALLSSALFIFFIARFTGNIFLVSAIVLSLILLKNYVPDEQSLFYKYWSKIPMSYFDFASITTGGQMYRRLTDININWLTGVKVQLIAIATLLVMICLTIYRRRKI
uniref:hypothetical protein n=1 Tax=Candidatus Enterococcus willemsii TaxID=1857215 RepID=UPI00403F685F